VKYDNIIAIDPDVDQSGVAVLDVPKKNIVVACLSFPKLLDFLSECKETTKYDGPVVVYVEASWLIKHNWHQGKRDNYGTASAKGNSTGRNHETGRKIVEMCKHYGLDVVEIHPLKKCWHGPDGKITHEEISHFIHGFPKRSNQEVRDAALIAWHYAGLPIVVKSKTQLYGKQ